MTAPTARLDVRPGPPPRATTSGPGDLVPRRADVQGLRAVSVLLVVLYHAGVPGTGGGYLGVDVFFVVSGFVITLALLRQHAATGRLDLPGFALGRIRRLVPTALVVVLCTGLAVWTTAPAAVLRGTGLQAAAAVLGVENLSLAASGVSYLADDSPAPFLHFWSLGVEEQFYLVWPLVLAGLLGRGRRRTTTVVVVGATCALSFGLAVAVSGWFAPWSFYLPVTRAWELGAGCLLALCRPSGARADGDRARWPGWAALAALLGALALTGPTLPHPSWPTLLPVGAAVLLLATPSGRGGSVSRVLALPVLTAVGDRSYSLYLWHWPALVVPVLALGRPLRPAEIVLALTVAVALAECTHRWVERRRHDSDRPRARRRCGRASTRRLLTATAASASALVVAGVVGATPVVGTAPSSVPWSDVTPTFADLPSSVPRTYSDGCHLERLETGLSRCRYGPARARFEALLVGDSHAAQWFSPLLDVVGEAGGALTSHTKSACPLVDLELRDPTLRRPYTECTQWREDVLARTAEASPDVIVVGAAGVGYRDEVSVPGPFEDAWSTALEHTLEDLHRAAPDADVVVLGDSPRWSLAPALCATSRFPAGRDCSSPSADLVDAGLVAAERAAAVRTGSRYVSTVEWLCDERCDVVVEGAFAYRDVSHVSDAVARRLAPALRAALTGTLP